MEIEPIVFKVLRVLRQSLSQGGRLVLAVSGGADSLALADACALLQQEGWCSLSVCHVEHGLRGEEALADARLVEGFCRERGLDFVCVHVPVKSYAEEQGLTTEEAARKLRYAALQQCRQEREAVAIVTAHHRDDQAETVLLKLLRGAGLEGLGAMQPQSGTLLRPFLQLTRAELEEYCAVRGLHYCQDSTNEDLYYTRNRVRLELLPYLEQSFNVNVKEALAHTAQLLQEDMACIAELVETHYQRLVQREENGIVIDAVALNELAPAVRKRVVRKAYFELGGKELSYERTQALDSFCQRRSGGKVLQLPGAIVASYAKKQLHLYYLNPKERPR